MQPHSLVMLSITLTSTVLRKPTCLCKLQIILEDIPVTTKLNIFFENDGSLLILVIRFRDRQKCLRFLATKRIYYSRFKSELNFKGIKNQI